MDDSADMNNMPDNANELESAAERLTRALDSLETRIGALATRASAKDADLQRLTTEVQQAEHFKSDRAELAARLDTLTAEARDKEAGFAAREREFETLARRTEDEISAIAAQVDAALKGLDLEGSDMKGQS